MSECAYIIGRNCIVGVQETTGVREIEISRNNNNKFNQSET